MSISRVTTIIICQFIDILLGERGLLLKTSELAILFEIFGLCKFLQSPHSQSTGEAAADFWINSQCI